MNLQTDKARQNVFLNLHKNFQKALQILPISFYSVYNVVGKKLIIGTLRSKQFL